MKLFVAIFFALVAVALAAEEKYTTKFDNVDIDEILKSNRLFNSYYKCLMDTGRCTPDGSELKRTLPDALKTNCSKCSPKQRDGTDRVIRYVSKNKPTEWAALRKKYDPNNEYVDKYRSEAAERDIKV